MLEHSYKYILNAKHEVFIPDQCTCIFHIELDENIESLAHSLKKICLYTKHRLFIFVQFLCILIIEFQ